MRDLWIINLEHRSFGQHKRNPVQTCKHINEADLNLSNIWKNETMGVMGGDCEHIQLR